MKKRILVVFLLMIAAVLLLSSCDFDFVTDLLPHEHVHEYGKWNVTTEATCTENGMMCRECECGEWEYKTIAATGHTESEWITKSTPNCIGSGEKYKECTVCHKILDKETISANGHSYGDWTETLAPTCTEKGEERRDCTNCDHYDTREVSAKGHSHTSVVTAPTCTEQGYTTHTCHCGDTYVDSYVDANGHSYGEWTETLAPTCTEKGEERRDCANCDHYDTREVSAKGHSHTSVVTAPTCTEQGYTTHTCHCGDTYVDSYVDANGHSYGEWTETLAPTCTEKGEERRDCTNCDHYETREIVANGHSHTSVVTEPTCTEQGYTTHTCHCGDTYVDTYVEANGHSYGEWTETLAPTCTEKGEERGDCANCDHYEMREIAASGHSFTDTVIAPTCTSFGYSIHVCDCGYYYLDCLESIIDHDYGEWYETLSPDCMNKGKERRDCKNCNYYETRELEVNGHVYGEWIDEISATCTESGTLGHYHCSVCHTNFDIDKNELSDLTIEKTGHKYENGTCMKCTELQPDSEGLQLILNSDKNGYVVLGMGDCKDTYIVIPSEYKGLPVVSIDAKAFRYTDIVGVRISENIKSIGEYAFYACSDLTSVMFVKDSTLSSVGNCAFMSCSKLTDINLPDSIRYISSSAFSSTAYYKNEQNWEDGVLYIGNHLIKVKTDVWGDYSIKEGTITIAENAFNDCTKIININIPSSVKSICNSAFSYCTNLASVTIPDSVTSIGSCAFAGCKEFTNITIPNSVTSIGSSAFYGCTGLTSLTIGNGVRTIGEDAFRGCTALIEINYNATECDDFRSSNDVFTYAGQNGNGIKVTIGSNVKKIPAYFLCPYENDLYVPKITEIVFQEGSDCESIGDYAFFYCISLKSATIPVSVTSIGTNAFGSCYKLTIINYTGTEEQWNAINKGSNSGLSNSNYTINYNYTTK